ncbi:hypothetical protein TIFTF001_026047 [Ficus carica]|uniref:Uncharacterized protein n=1 Tax=Ficus carica TaxID=3494 RepID=A0AA88DES6_FICCA|nr:hypothetical protein TIFTF001_026047 [Ficus carica]
MFQMPKLETTISQAKEVCSNFSQKSPPDGSSKYLVGSAPSNLTLLSLHDNLLNGTIPSWIYELPYLEDLRLDNNLFAGEIREFKSTSLQLLSLSENKLWHHSKINIPSGRTPVFGSFIK